MFQKLFLWMKTYERHLSALAMVAGFIVDSLFFGRVDLLETQLVFAVYAAICFVSIPLLHWIESHMIPDKPLVPHLRALLPLATQFALGGFWSGLVIFYGRSADLGASWPFLLLLFFILLGSEYFQQYRARLVFTSILFFFALYSYAIFAVPIATGTIGTLTFLLSGAVAIGAFALFIALLRLFARERFLLAVWRIRAGAGAVFILINIFYFTNILPPLPLAAKAAGIYHSVSHEGGGYRAQTETAPWYVAVLGFAPILHVVQNDSLYAYSSVFAPTTLQTTIVHRWQWYDPVVGEWITRAAIAYPISGGRDGGYRGYSSVLINEIGKWRVDVETADGRRIARLPFTAVRVASSTPTIEQTLD